MKNSNNKQISKVASTQKQKVSVESKVGTMLLMLGSLFVLSLFFTGCIKPKIVYHPVAPGEEDTILGNETALNEDNLVKDEGDIPIVCTMEYDPVCGTDGKTYGNACGAKAAKTQVVYPGECGDKDAMIAGKELVACTREYMPVCGADGLTYSNKCEAGNMSIISEGACEE